MNFRSQDSGNQLGLGFSLFLGFIGAHKKSLILSPILCFQNFLCLELTSVLLGDRVFVHKVRSQIGGGLIKIWEDRIPLSKLQMSDYRSPTNGCELIQFFTTTFIILTTTLLTLIHQLTQFLKNVVISLFCFYFLSFFTTDCATNHSGGGGWSRYPYPCQLKPIGNKIMFLILFFQTLKR